MAPEEGVLVPHKQEIPHYHGDEVRILFLIAGLIAIFAQSTGAGLPLSTSGVVLGSVLLVIAAGITNPKQVWIHWVNFTLALLGSFIFCRAAILHYREDFNVFDGAFIYIEALALISLVSLYFTIRTIRGIMLRP